MRSFVLRARPWQFPHGGVAVQFDPGHARDLLPTRPCEEHHLEDRTKRRRDLVACLPEVHDLTISQDPLARLRVLRLGPRTGLSVTSLCDRSHENIFDKVACMRRAKMSVLPSLMRRVPGTPCLRASSTTPWMSCPSIVPTGQSTQRSAKPLGRKDPSGSSPSMRAVIIQRRVRLAAYSLMNLCAATAN